MQRFHVFGEGCDILDPVLQPHGYLRTDEYEYQYPSIMGAGPVVVRGGFIRGDRHLELELSYALSKVVYRIDDLCLEHGPYMKALGVPPGASAYPGFSDDPLDGFRHLASDLRCFATEFLAGDALVFRRAASDEAGRRPQRHRRYQAWMVGDDSARQRARQVFRERRFREVVALLEALKYPEFMDDYEKKILEVSRRRSAADLGSGGAPA